MSPEEKADLAALLDEVVEFLDNYADAEGNGPADYRPNRAMTLMNEVQQTIDRIQRS